MPRVLRLALILAGALGALVSFGAARDVAITLSAKTVVPKAIPLGSFSEWIPNPEAHQEAMKAQQAAMLAAIESMATPRLFILMALSTVTTFMVIAAIRLRWSPEVPRTAMARLLGGASIAAAILRTIDGAQELVINRNGAEASGQALIAAQIADAEVQANMAVTVISGISIVWTAAIVGVLVILGQYFRSPRMAELIDRS